MIHTLFIHHTHFDPTAKDLDEIGKRYPQLEIFNVKQKDYGIKDIVNAEIIVGLPHPQDLLHARKLKWLQTPSAGVSEYLHKDLFCNDVVVTKGSGTYGRQISDQVMASMIALNHNFPLYFAQKQKHIWSRQFPKKDLWNSTVLILGFGDIGKQVAQKAKAAGMHVVVVKRELIEKPAYVDELFLFPDLDLVLSSADFIVLCLASTKETETMINAERIGLLKDGVFFINVARGSLVDEKALVDALRTGRIAGAALDATLEEPLPVDSPLWDLDNVILTPHSSGLSPSITSFVLKIFLENVGHYLNGEKMNNLADFDLMY